MKYFLYVFHALFILPFSYKKQIKKLKGILTDFKISYKLNFKIVFTRMSLQVFSI